jgi:hypothetical protein
MRYFIIFIFIFEKKGQWQRDSQLLLWSIPCPYFGQAHNLETAKAIAFPRPSSSQNTNRTHRHKKAAKSGQSYLPLFKSATASASKSAPRDQHERTFFLFVISPSRNGE